jgi:uncharacterized membrane protein YhiD involved in acid resistance
MKLKRKKLISVLYILIIIAVLGVFLGGFIKNKEITAAENSELAALDSQTGESVAARPDSEIPFLSQILNTEAVDSEVPLTKRASEIVFRLFLAVLLSALLAFRPQRKDTLFQRNFHVVQTQILVSVVAAALMMIVGDNAARAFAIFAAVSLVRFRTNIRDPKEITVLLVTMAIGLAAGVGRWELGVILCFFVLGLLWLLEQNESEKDFRSMQLTVATRNTDKTQELLKKIFTENEIDAEIRQIFPSDNDDKSGKIRYFLNLRLNTGTDFLNDRIFYSDPDNIKKIDWRHKRKEKNIYQ